MSLKRNTLWSLAGTGLPLIIGAVTIPYLIKETGVEVFGILTLTWALIGYFSIFDFGLGKALTQQVSILQSSGNKNDLPSLVKSGLIFTIVTGLIGLFLLGGLSYQLSFKWLGVSSPMQLNTFYSLLIASIGIPLTTLTTGLRGVLEAFEDFKATSILRMLLGSANFGLPVIAVKIFGPSLPMMVASLIVARILILTAHTVLVSKKLPIGWIGAKLSKHNIRRLMSFGAWMTISNIVSPLMVTADRFIISSVLGASVVAYYTIPFELVIRVLIIPTAFTTVLFPRLSSLLITNPHRANYLYHKSLVATVVTLIPICGTIAILSEWGTKIWLGPDFSRYAWPMVPIMALGLLLNGAAYMPFAINQAAGNVRGTAALHLCEFLIYVPLLFILLKSYGLVGAACAWCIRASVDLLVLNTMARKIILNPKGSACLKPSQKLSAKSLMSK